MVHILKERFLPKGNLSCTFEVMAHFRFLSVSITTFYKVDLLSKYNVSAIFNVSDLFPFDACLDLRMNSFKERGNDVI